MPKRLPSFFFILLLLFTVPACAVKKTSSLNHVLGASLSPQLVLENIDRNDHGKDMLKAIARIYVNTSEGRYPLKAAVILKRPSSLRLEVLPLIGPPVMILSVHDDVLKVFLPEKGEFYIGRASARNLGLFFPFSTLGLQMEDIISILIGMHPEIKEKTVTMSGSSEGNVYRIDMLAGNKKVQALWVDMENNYLTRVDLFAGNTLQLYSVRFAEHDSIGNYTMPREVMVASGNCDKPDVIIRYSDVQMTTGPDITPFDLQPPPGIKTLQIR